MAESHAAPSPSSPGHASVLGQLGAICDAHGLAPLAERLADLADLTAGALAARMLYGNAASIFAGDWLLVLALRRVRRATIPGLLERLLDVIETMIFAESEKLERRGGLHT